ncbi:MAG: hypothetical protein M1822_004358 [Bathelium mastoideum]|nr:MAG: hypothetical protein M1822_004358 [Bathelium mastoideum]
MGGTNPALRTFFYRLLRLLLLSIHPLFVFDGPNQPPFKRNKRTGQNIASVPDFLAKQLLQQFGFPYHRAPGEAEAECALLQQKGVVDAVLSEDVDTLMFGSGITIRNWSSELRSGGTPTHVNLYDAQKIKAGPSEMDPHGMILVGLMSGGDYTPQGIPGCGPKIACEAARAGFGAELCHIPRGDRVAIRAWRDKLAHELKTNENKYFRQKHKALAIPEDFPSLEVLGYYTRPAVSEDTAVKRLQESIRWDMDIDLPALRTFTADAFDWTKVQGAKHFIRNLAPAILTKQLRLTVGHAEPHSRSIEATQQEESKFVRQIFGMRNHGITDNCTELRLGFVPLDLVPLNLDDEEPDEEGGAVEEEMIEDALTTEDDISKEQPEAASKKRTPTNYDPSKLDRVWILDTFAKFGVPLMVEDWEEKMKSTERLKQTKAAKALANTSSGLSSSQQSKKAGGMPKGALDRYAKVTKPSENRSRPLARSQSLQIEEIDLANVPQSTAPSLGYLRSDGRRSDRTKHESVIETIDLCSSPAPRAQQHHENLQAPDLANMHMSRSSFSRLPDGSGRSKRSPFRRSISAPQTESAEAFLQQTRIPLPLPTASTIVEDNRLEDMVCIPSSPPESGPRATDTGYGSETDMQNNEDPNLTFDAPCPRTPSRTAGAKNMSYTTLVSSPSRASPGKQRNIQDFFASNLASEKLPETKNGTACKFRTPNESTYGKCGHASSNQSGVLKKTSGNSRSRQNAQQLGATGSDSANGPAQRHTGKRTLDLRASLDGTWKISKADCVESQSSQRKKLSSVASSSTRILGDVGKRSWGLSEVETLDLTGD